MEQNKTEAKVALSMRAEGAPVEEIISKTGLEPQEVVDIIARAGDAVTTLQGIREEAALMSFGVTKRDRLQKLAALRDKMEKELESRDFSDIPTDKIPVILLKINQAIREEVTPPRILSKPIVEDYWAVTGTIKDISTL